MPNSKDCKQYIYSHHKESLELINCGLFTVMHEDEAVEHRIYGALLANGGRNKVTPEPFEDLRLATMVCNSKTVVLTQTYTFQGTSQRHQLSGAAGSQTVVIFSKHHSDL